MYGGEKENAKRKDGIEMTQWELYDITDIIEAEIKAENERARKYIELNPSDASRREGIRSAIESELNYIAFQIRKMYKRKVG